MVFKSPLRMIPARRQAFEKALGGVKETYIDKVLGIEPGSLMAYYPMNEDAGAVADNAEGTAARDGAYTGATLGQPGIGDGNTCPLLDGSNDYVTLPAGFQSAWNGDEYTLAVWARVYNVGVWTDSTARFIVRVRVNSSNQVQITRSATNGRLAFLCESGNEPLTRSIDGLSTTDFFHIAITNSLTDGQVRYYYNGAEVGAPSVRTQAWVGVPGTTYIGAADNTPTSPWYGYIAHSGFWTTALTPAQIANLAVV